MPFVSVTYLHVRSVQFLPPFVWSNLTIVAQLRAADGFLAGGLAADIGKRAFRTITLWRDRRAMMAFRNAGAHMQAMPKLCPPNTRPEFALPAPGRPASAYGFAVTLDAGRRPRLRAASKQGARRP